MTAAGDTDPTLVGHYAGAATRLAAFVIDIVISVTVFNLAIAAMVWLVNWFTPWTITSSSHEWVWLIGLMGWEFVYFWYCLTLAGRTPGKAFFGLRVVRGTGSDLQAGKAALRVVAMPLSWMFFGLGFIGIVFGRHKRALHDVIADTAVVYDFDARAAHLRFLARQPTEEPARKA